MIYRFEDCTLDTERLEFRRGSELVRLEPQVFDFLAYLIEHRERVVPRQEVLDRIWPEGFVTEATLNSRLMAARKAIGDSGREQRLIRTVHARGFRFTGQVLEESRRARLNDALVAAPRPSLDAALDLVGREQEMGHLHAWLRAAEAGQRQTVLVTGEAGIGKTALVDAFREQVAGRADLRFVRGQCVERHGASEPYMPVLQALSRLGKEPDGEAVVGELMRSAPTWLAEMPWLVQDERLVELRVGALGATEARMLREMVEFLERLSTEHPVVLILEDLHWSDYSTIDLIAALASRREPARLLILGTYRPEIKATQHPLWSMKQELRVKGQCVEMALPLLSDETVTHYVKRRLPGLNSAALAGLLLRKTEGNPLFIENLLFAWQADGLLVRIDEGWTLRASMGELESGVPQTLTGLIEDQTTGLSQAERGVLQAAAVAGQDFMAGAIAEPAGLGQEECEALCLELSRKRLFLRRLEPLDLLGGATTERFEFAHSLYREVLYASLAASRRVSLHRLIGRRLEELGAADAPERASEMAMHFVQGGEPQAAVEYLQKAAEQALQRSAHREAAEILTTALDLVRGTGDDRRELRLQALLASVLIKTEGWSAPRASAAFEQAVRLGRLTGDAEGLASALYGLATMCEFRGRYRDSQSLIEQRLRLPAEVQQSESLAESHELLACSLFHQGAFELSLEHSSSGLAQLDKLGPNAATASIGEDPAASSHGWAALALWFLGYPDEAVVRARAMIEMTQDPSRAYSLANAYVFAARVHQQRREPEMVTRYASLAVSRAGEGGYPYQHGVGLVLRGWASVATGNQAEGLAELRQGLLEHESTGAEMDRPYLLGLFAESLLAAGAYAEGHAVLDEALTKLPADRRFFYEAELHRLAGDFLRIEHRDAEAEESYARAISAARGQKARSLELRAAVSRGYSLMGLGQVAEAYQLLRVAVAAFPEGTDTPDLAAAGSLLERLRDVEGRTG